MPSDGSKGSPAGCRELFAGVRELGFGRLASCAVGKRSKRAGQLPQGGVGLRRDPRTGLKRDELRGRLACLRRDLVRVV